MFLKSESGDGQLNDFPEYASYVTAMFRVYVGNPAVKIGFNEAPPRPTGSLHTIELKDCHSLASHAVPEILITCIIEMPCMPMIVIEDPSFHIIPCVRARCP